MTNEPIPHPPVPVILLAVAVAVGLLRTGLGCAGLTPGDRTAIESVAIALCPLESMVPILGPFAALACPGEEAALKAALDAMPSALGAKATIGMSPTLDVYRKGPKGLVHVGRVASYAAPAVQRAIDTAAK